MTVAKSLCLPLLPSVRRHIWFHFVWCCIAQGDHVKHCNFNESLCKSLSGLHKIENTNTFEKVIAALINYTEFETFVLKGTF